MSKGVTGRKRATVRERAKNRCEYWRRPDNVGYAPFQVDHIIPYLHGGTSALDKIAWACFHCNVNKGPNIASIDPTTKALAPLFNPRKQKWDDHFELDSIDIRGLTPEGRATVQVLAMNDPEQLLIRRDLIDTELW